MYVYIYIYSLLHFSNDKGKNTDIYIYIIHKENKIVDDAFEKAEKHM